MWDWASWAFLALGLLAAAAGVASLVQGWRFARYVHRSREAASGPLPPVVVLAPVRLADPGLGGNLVGGALRLERERLQRAHGRPLQLLLGRRDGDAPGFLRRGGDPPALAGIAERRPGRHPRGEGAQPPRALRPPRGVRERGGHR